MIFKAQKAVFKIFLKFQLQNIKNFEGGPFGDIKNVSEKNEKKNSKQSNKAEKLKTDFLKLQFAAKYQKLEVTFWRQENISKKVAQC